MKCESCKEKDEQLKDAESLIINLTTAIQDTTKAIEILNLKITEQETMIMKLNNGIVKAVNINTFKRKVVS